MSTPVALPASRSFNWSDQLLFSRNPHTRRQHSLWASMAVEEYFELIFRAYNAYTKLVPYWDPAMLPNFGWHANHRVVRTKTTNRIVELPNLLQYAKALRGKEAAMILSLLQEVRVCF